MDVLANFLIYVVPFMLILSIVVFFHEYGHFIVGRLCGVKVDAFSIGFGPELWARDDRQGTRWRIAAIPLGGYVKFHGDANGASVPDAASVEAMPESERAVTFAAQNVWKRSAIVFAGPAFNFVLAILLYWGMFAYYGRTVLVPKIAGVVAGSAGDKAGFKAGDLVLSIDGAPIDSFQKMQEIVSMSAEKALHFVVRRNGQPLAFDATPAWREVDSPVGKARIGRLELHASNEPGDIHEESYGIVGSLGMAFGETGAVVERTYNYLGGLITGRENADQLSGPIGIAQVSGEMAQAVSKVGLWPVLNLIAILSISIGLLNLMPVPLLDGGHLLFFSIEALRGKALAERTQEFAFRVGLAMVCSLMVFSTYNDIARIVRKMASGGS